MLLFLCYLAPEASPYGRDAGAFFDHLESTVHNLLTEYDHLFNCGDFNARVGLLHDCITDVDIVLPDRKVIDDVINAHDGSFIDFLISNEMGILNGRLNDVKNNYTCIARGRSVVNYIICPHDQLKSCSDFQV